MNQQLLTFVANLSTLLLMLAFKITFFPRSFQRLPLTIDDVVSQFNYLSHVDCVIPIRRVGAAMVWKKLKVRHLVLPLAATRRQPTSLHEHVFILRLLFNRVSISLFFYFRESFSDVKHKSKTSRNEFVIPIFHP